MSKNLMYLRKSRTDRDFVDESIEMTLQRHKTRLDAFCISNHISIDEVLYEVVSADSISERPEMIKLLHLVETGDYDGVVVTDLDRLCRGDSIDQGIVSNTFKYSGTKIITPLKTYDFGNEFDEEYAEFGLMMGRREYRIIKRRLFNGRLDAVREGKYVGGNAPYGYETYKLEKQKGFSLKIIPEQADIVQLIFNMYINGLEENRCVGSYAIARKLNEMGYVNQFGKAWNQGHITKILSDETYIGKVVFMRRKQRKVVEAGKVKTVEENNSDEKMVCQGLHEPIITDEMYQQAQEKKSKNSIPHLRKSFDLQNPFCRIITCSLCGKNLQLRAIDKTGKRALFCPNVNCTCKGSYMDLIEERFLEALKKWATGYVVESKPVETDYSSMQKSLLNSVAHLEKERAKLQKQLDNTYVFLEQGTYSIDVFKTRSDTLNSQITELNEKLAASNNELTKIREYETAKVSLLPRIQTLIAKYDTLDSPKEKNNMIAEVIERIAYTKTIRGKTHADAFEIMVFPKIPKL